VGLEEKLERVCPPGVRGGACGNEGQSERQDNPAPAEPQGTLGNKADAAQDQHRSEEHEDEHQQAQFGPVPTAGVKVLLIVVQLGHLTVFLSWVPVRRGTEGQWETTDSA
jgi:hypothetical protein